MYYLLNSLITFILVSQYFTSMYVKIKTSDSTKVNPLHVCWCDDTYNIELTCNNILYIYNNTNMSSLSCGDITPYIWCVVTN